MAVSDEDRRILTPEDVAAEGLEDWELVAGVLTARFATGSFARGLALVNGVGEEAERVDHHPDVDLRYPYVDIRLVSHDVGGITQRDLRLARAVSEVARRLEVASERP